MNNITKGKKTTLGYIIIGTCLILFAALITTAFVLKGDEYDPVSFCPKKITAHTVIVMDKTDSLSASQQDFVSKYVIRAKDNLKTFEKLTIFTLTENSFIGSAPMFSKCNPGTGEFANQLYQNPQRIQSRFDELFAKPLSEIIDNMLADNTSSKSPIFEMIRELSFRDDFGDQIKDKTLIIISDLMHHTPEYSHYRNNYTYECFSKLPYAFEVEANLKYVKIKIVYLVKNKLEKVQGKKHLSFWKDYFYGMGVETVEVKKIR